MKLFRISREKYSTDLSGEGARLYGGRWNRMGTAILYTSENESLAVLETLAHVPVSSVPDDLMMLVLSVSDEFEPETIDEKFLPEQWKRYPASRYLADLGTAWARSQSSVMLRVPSALVETDRNMLINPSHPDMSQVTINEVRVFRFDYRWKE